jgi:hypothetical protein
MDKEKVLKVVKEIIFDKISNLIDEVSTNEFLEQVSTEVYDENEPPTDFDEQEKIKEIIGDKIIPILFDMVEIVTKSKKVIEVDISFYHPNDDETKKVYDVEGMEEEFQYKLKQVIKSK